MTIVRQRELHNKQKFDGVMKLKISYRQATIEDVELLIDI